MTVPIVTTAAGADGHLLEQAVLGAFDADGFVIQTTGRGGTSESITAATQAALEAGIPVVSTSRCYYGPRMSSPDGGTVIAMENMPAWKARIALIVGLTITTDLEELRELVAGGKYGRGVVAASTVG